MRVECGLSYASSPNAFPKGEAVHVPAMVGQYVTTGEWAAVTALTKVHFAASTMREPQLLVCFIDYAMSNPAMTGISVQTVPLPLMPRQGTFSTTSYITKMQDVIGFETACKAAARKIYVARCPRGRCGGGAARSTSTARSFP